MNRILYLFILSVIMTLFMISGALAQVTDRIVAVVGDEIILLSELETRLQLAGMQFQIDPQDVDTINELRRALLQDLVDEKLTLVQARRDSIQVTSQEVDNALALQIQQIKDQLGSEEAFQEELTNEGLTLLELKKRYRPQIRNQILRERLIREKLANVTVTSKEVMDFYTAYRDSLPVQGESVRLNHLMLNVSASDEEKREAFQLAKEVLAKVRAGESFAALARSYSQCPSAEKGGELGYFSRGEMVPEFEQAAFALQPGDISDVVETMYGYHIINCEDRRNDQTRVRHILIALNASEADEQRIIIQLNELRERALNGEDFSALAEEYSQDPYTREKGGDLGWYPLDQLNPQFRSAIENLQTGDITEPINSGSGYHLLRIFDRVSQRQITLEDDWEGIQELTRQKKVSDKLEAWLNQLRSEIYVDVRL